MTNRIPDGWEERRLEDLCTDIAHINPMKNPDEEFEYIDVSSVSNESFKIMNTTRYDGRNAPSRAQKLVCFNDVLYSTVRPSLRHIAFIPKYLHGQICSTAFCVLRANQTKIVPNYLYQLMITEELNTRITKYEQGSNYPAVLDSDIFKQLIIMPKSLKEQQKIADILLTVDTTIEKTRALIEKHKMMKQGLMKDLFEPNPLPQNWVKYTLADVCRNAINGGTPSTKNSHYWNGTIPWISGADIIDQKVGEIRRHTNEEGVRNSSTNVIPKGNLLVVTRTGVGKIAIAPYEIAISQDFTGFIPNELGNVEFLYYLLDHYKDYFINLTQGTSINGITREDLLEFRFSCPKSIKEQNEIALVLRTADNMIEIETLNLTKLLKLKSGLMHDLLTGEVRVKVGG